MNAANATISDNVVHNMPIGINVVGVGIAGVITVQGNTVYSNGTGIEAFQSIFITGNTVHGNAGSGINLTRSSRAVNNVVYGNLDGIREVANGSVVSGNRVFGNSRTGIIADGDVPITGNVVYSNATGISVSSYAGRIANNLIYGNSSVGVALAGTGIAGYPPAYFVNNTVYQTSGDALAVTPANVIVVRNNVLWAANGTGIKVSGASAAQPQQRLQHARAGHRPPGACRQPERDRRRHAGRMEGRGAGLPLVGRRPDVRRLRRPR